MHPAHSRRLKHKKAEDERVPVQVYRNGKLVGVVGPRLLGPQWYAEVKPHGPMLGGIFSNIKDGELAIVNHEKAMGR